MWFEMAESESESESLYDCRFTANHFVLAGSPLRLTTNNFIFQLNTCGYSVYVTSSLTRGFVYCLQLLLASRQRSRSQVRVPPDSWPNLVPQIQDSSNLEGQVPVFISPRNTYTSRHWVPFHRLLRLAGLRWKYSNRPPRGDHWLVRVTLPLAFYHRVRVWVWVLYYDRRWVGQSVLA
jgi:hypothetical protein